jgi:hypothetical protein
MLDLCHANITAPSPTLTRNINNPLSLLLQYILNEYTEIYFIYDPAN